MSVSSKMTAIADKIRALLGISGTMSLDVMATNLTTEQTNVTNAFTAVSSKGGTVPSSKVSGNLASAINSIPAGVEVKEKRGTFNTDPYGYASVNCGFKPDMVLFTQELYEPKDGSYYESHAAVVFPEQTYGDVDIFCIGLFGTYKENIIFLPVQSADGFSVSVEDNSGEAVHNVQFKYVAIKYTE